MKREHRNKLADYARKLGATIPESYYRGDKGDTGPQGEPGLNGTDGKNGKDGLSGKNGIDGKDGITPETETLVKEVIPLVLRRLPTPTGNANRNIVVESQTVLTPYTDINFVGTTSSIIAVTDNQNKQTIIQIPTGGGGGGSPASPDTSIQYNNSGAFGGDANLTWSTGDAQLTVGTGVPAPNAVLGTSGLKFNFEGNAGQLFGGNATTTDTNGTGIAISSGNGNGTGVAGATTLFSDTIGLIIGGVAVGLSSNFPGLTIDNGTTVAYLNPTALSTSRTYAFPDASGTFALQSAVTADVVVGAQTLHFTNGILTSIT